MRSEEANQLEPGGRLHHFRRGVSSIAVFSSRVSAGCDERLSGWQRLHHRQYGPGIRVYVLTLPAMHVDETSLRVDKKNHWIHVCSAGEITLKCLHPKRGLEAMQDIGVCNRSKPPGRRHSA